MKQMGKWANRQMGKWADVQKANVQKADVQKQFYDVVILML